MNRRFAIVLTALTFLGAVTASAADPDGAALFKQCAMCHGADGAGQTPAGKMMKVRDLRADAVQKQTDMELMKIISGGKGKMPAFGKKLTTAEITAVIAYLRTLKAH
jgi:mono/diheme cytochrome c family protein